MMWHLAFSATCLLVGFLFGIWATWDILTPPHQDELRDLKATHEAACRVLRAQAAVDANTQAAV